MPLMCRGKQERMKMKGLCRTVLISVFAVNCLFLVISALFVIGIFDPRLPKPAFYVLLFYVNIPFVALMLLERPTDPPKKSKASTSATAAASQPPTTQDAPSPRCRQALLIFHPRGSAVSQYAMHRAPPSSTYELATMSPQMPQILATGQGDVFISQEGAASFPKVEEVSAGEATPALTSRLNWGYNIERDSASLQAAPLLTSQEETSTSLCNMEGNSAMPPPDSAVPPPPTSQAMLLSTSRHSAVSLQKYFTTPPMPHLTSQQAMTSLHLIERPRDSVVPPTSHAAPLTSFQQGNISLHDTEMQRNFVMPSMASDAMHITHQQADMAAHLHDRGTQSGHLTYQQEEVAARLHDIDMHWVDMMRRREAKRMGTRRNTTLEELPAVGFEEACKVIRRCSTREEQRMNCGICLEDFEKQEQVHLFPNCSHLFHVGCVKHWLLLVGSCPCCRNVVVNIKDP